MPVPIVVESVPDAMNKLVAYSVSHKLPSGKRSAISVKRRGYVAWTTSLVTAKRAAARAVREGKQEVQIKQFAQAGGKVL